MTYKILLVQNKYDWRVFGRIIFKRFIGILIPVAILFTYLSINNSINSFVDYAIKGISTFDNYISYINLYYCSNITKVLCIAVPFSFISMFILTVIKTPKSNWQKELFIIFAFSLPTFIVTFPISDKIHFYIAIIPSLIGIIYMLWLLINKIKCKKIILKITNILLFLLLVYSAFLSLKEPIKNLKTYCLDYKKYNQLKHFKYVPISQGLEKNILDIDKYILEQKSLGKKVYILDASASLFMIPLDKYTKDYDMFLKGNLGEKGEDGIVDRIKSEKNAIYLIKSENQKINWQNPTKVREYIIENLDKVGKKISFDIYLKK